MLTTGFKYWFGQAMAFAVAAVVYGYTTGGNGTGPISLGWKGGVGDLLGYTVLVALALVCAVVAVVVVAFRDADPSAQAELVGAERVATAPLVGPSFWPVVGAFGVLAAVIGLALDAAVFVAGLVLIAAVVVEWTMDAWADRATGDQEANRELRNRIMAPIEIPALAAAGIALLVLSFSRIMLAVSKDGAVVFAGVVSLLILGGTVFYVARPRLPRNVVAGALVVGGVAVLGAGVAAAVVGEREFEVHGEEGEHGEDEGVEAEGDEEAPAEGETGDMTDDTAEDGG